MNPGNGTDTSIHGCRWSVRMTLPPHPAQSHSLTSDRPHQLCDRSIVQNGLRPDIAEIARLRLSSVCKWPELRSMDWLRFNWPSRRMPITAHMSACTESAHHSSRFTLARSVGNIQDAGRHRSYGKCAASGGLAFRRQAHNADVDVPATGARVHHSLL